MLYPNNDILQNDQRDSIDSYFECVTACSLTGEGVECVTRCIEVHLKKEDWNMSKNPPIQRKTTLKWSSNGELSSIDKARILEKLTNKELTECEFACDLENSIEPGGHWAELKFKPQINGF